MLKKWSKTLLPRHEARKKMAFASVLSLLLVSFLAAPAHAGLSAVRNANVSSKHYVETARINAINNGDFSNGVLGEKGDFKNAKWDRVPELSEADLQKSFEFARDEKPFTDEENRSRRATWLYPDDGCFVRAAVATDLVRQQTSVKLAKIFAFGNLAVKTDNSPEGEVTWWYHVAAIAKVVDPTTKSATYFVYDPAISPKKPMEVTAWLKAMHTPDADVAICSGDSYDPDSNCGKGQPDVYGRAQSEASWFLPSEWMRLEDLGRDPKKELGDSPPWLK